MRVLTSVGEPDPARPGPELGQLSAHMITVTPAAFRVGRSEPVDGLWRRRAVFDQKGGPGCVAGGAGFLEGAWRWTPDCCR